MHIVQILIPLFLNNGQKIPTWVYTQFELALLVAFGGFTKAQQAYVGQWRNDKGQTMTDKTVAYMVALEDINKLTTILDGMNTHFQQESFFLMDIGESTMYTPDQERT